MPDSRYRQPATWATTQPTLIATPRVVHKHLLTARMRPSSWALRLQRQWSHPQISTSPSIRHASRSTGLRPRVRTGSASKQSPRAKRRRCRRLAFTLQHDMTCYVEKSVIRRTQLMYPRRKTSWPQPQTNRKRVAEDVAHLIDHLAKREHDCNPHVRHSRRRVAQACHTKASSMRPRAIVVLYRLMARQAKTAAPCFFEQPPSPKGEDKRAQRGRSALSQNAARQHHPHVHGGNNRQIIAKRKLSAPKDTRED